MSEPRESRPYKLPNVTWKVPQWHEKKNVRITAYLTENINLDIEAARLKLLEGGQKTDRTAMVRAAVDFLLLDYELNGDDSWLVRRTAIVNQHP